MKHCELLGYNMSEDECNETRSDDFNECQDCKGGEKKMAIKEEVKAEATCGDCGKKAAEDKYFSFKRGLCCACRSREDRAKKAGKEKKIRKPISKAPQPTTPAPPYQRGEPKEKTIVLNFSGYPELFETLTTLAREEMRTPEMQALYLLKEGDFSGLNKGYRLK